MPVRATRSPIFPSSSHVSSGPEPAKACTVEPLLENINTAERRTIHFRKKQKIFAQGEIADSVYLLQKGKVKISVVSPEGREAALSLIGPGEFFGETCLTSRPRQVHTATAVTDCSVVKITRPCMVQALHEEQRLSEAFLEQLLNRNLEYQQVITDHIVSSSEQRLAAILIRLSRFAPAPEGESAEIPRLSHQTLADMIGTTRPRVTFFMNKFRKLGLLEYNGGLRVNVEKLQSQVLGRRQAA